MSITQPPKDFQTLFLDMNSFFASVEQQVLPHLRGRPIGVAPYTGSSGCIIAASREAKKRGVRIGRVGEAKKLCPELVIVESRPALYMVYHKEIKKVIEEFTPFFTPLSIDEFVLRLTPKEQNEIASLNLARKIKARLRERVGEYLTCSIGIGPSKFLAKMAGERRKPDGLSVVRLSELEKFYHDLSLLDITGINFRMQSRLNFLKIYSPTDLFNLPLPRLRSCLGHPGRQWYFRLRGYEVDDSEVKNKTIGHSHVLAPELRTVEGAKSVLKKLAFKAGFRMRKEGYWAGGVFVSVRFMSHEGFHLSRRTESFCDNQSFVCHLSLLLKECRWKSRPIYVSVAAFNLTRPIGAQISIFSEEERERNLSRAIDSINDEYGASTVLPASLFLAGDSAPDRISFGQPRYDIIH